MCPVRFPIPSQLLESVERPGRHYDPRPTTTVIHERDAIIERQRDHLRDLDLWARRLKGPCSKCRWNKDGYYCENPAVAEGKGDPVTGDIKWSYPSLEDERREKRLPLSWGSWEYASVANREAHSVPTLCGPEGLLFEPRTYKQFLARWALSGLWLIPIVVAALIIAGAVLSSVHRG